MQKDFDKWNEKKKEVHAQSTSPFFHQREVWWCSLGINVGDEQNGTGTNFDRPVVIVTKFNNNIFLGVALTGKKKTGKYYHALGKIGDREACAVLSQVRLTDAKRLIKKIETLDEGKFSKLKQAMEKILFR